LKPSDQKSLIFSPHSIKGIAFDLDDTLFSRSAAVTSWLHTLGISAFDKISLRDQNGDSQREIFFDWLSAHLHLSTTGQALHQRFITELPHHILPQTSHLETLRILQTRGYQLALLSNGGSTLQRAKLKATGLTEIFAPNNILISGELTGDKPDESVFQELTSRMNLAPHKILFVGDHPENDIAGSHRLGMSSAWIKNDRKTPLNFPSDVLIIDELTDLLPHFPGHERS
jgi:putative hydrolase of the HAD superfamily